MEWVSPQGYITNILNYKTTLFNIKMSYSRTRNPEGLTGMKVCRLGTLTQAVGRTL